MENCKQELCERKVCLFRPAVLGACAKQPKSAFDLHHCAGKVKHHGCVSHPAQLPRVSMFHIDLTPLPAGRQQPIPHPRTKQKQNKRLTGICALRQRPAGTNVRDCSWLQLLRRHARKRLEAGVDGSGRWAGEEAAQEWLAYGWL